MLEETERDVELRGGEGYIKCASSPRVSLSVTTPERFLGNFLMAPGTLGHHLPLETD